MEVEKLKAQSQVNNETNKINLNENDKKRLNFLDKKNKSFDFLYLFGTIVTIVLIIFSSILGVLSEDSQAWTIMLICSAVLLFTAFLISFIYICKIISYWRKYKKLKWENNMILEKEREINKNVENKKFMKIVGLETREKQLTKWIKNNSINWQIQ